MISVEKRSNLVPGGVCGEREGMEDVSMANIVELLFVLEVPFDDELLVGLYPSDTTNLSIRLLLLLLLFCPL